MCPSHKTSTLIWWVLSAPMVEIGLQMIKIWGELTPLPPGFDSPDTGTQTFAISLMSDGIDSYHKVELYSYKHSKNNPEKYCGL